MLPSYRSKQLSILPATYFQPVVTEVAHTILTVMYHFAQMIIIQELLLQTRLYCIGEGI